MIEPRPHVRFLAANQELRVFLARVEAQANGTGTVTACYLQVLARRLQNTAPEVGDASRSETLDSGLQLELAEYVRNLRALQAGLERVRYVMFARRAQTEAARLRMDGLQGWVNAYRQTT